MLLPLLLLSFIQYILLFTFVIAFFSPSSSLSKPNSPNTRSKQLKEVDMEAVIIPTREAIDFDFNSARSSPCVTAPSTPRRFGDYYMSAPTSPTRMSDFYREFDEFSNISNWEDDQPSPDAATRESLKPENEDDFAFDVSTEEVKRTSLSAEELFDGGVMRPFKPPPTTSAPRSPSFFRQVLSPRRKKGKDHPSEMENTTNRSEKRSDQQHQRGRDRAPAALSSSVSGRRATRSLSPLRVLEYQWEEEEKKYQQQQQQLQQNNKQLAPEAMFASSTTTSASSKSSRKWKLKDFLLFRSASEGRATDKDPFRKYSTLFMKNSSFRSIDSPVSVSSSRRRGPPVSAHELHYTVNKAVSEDLKKKTFLPYKQGILGRLAFNPAVSALANGFGSLSRS